MLRACVRDRDVLPADRSIDVRFHEFMADDVGTVERIYDLAGQPMTDEARAAMAQFMVDHPRGRHGAVEYDLTQFGLDPDERRAALRVLLRPLRRRARILRCVSEPRMRGSETHLTA